MSGKHIVAVYGSLLKGFGNNRLLQTSKLLGETQIPLKGRLISLGGFPGLVNDEEEQCVSAEVYLVDDHTLHRLDCLEGHPRFYKRELVDTEHGEAWIYWIQDERYLEYPVVPDNNWRNYVTEQSTNRAAL